MNIKGADVSAKAWRGFLSAIYGLAKSLSVMPGDTIKMQVYAKYLDPDANNWTSALGDFMAAVAGGTAPPGTVVDGGVTGSIGSGSFPFPGLLNHSGEPETAPKAYLNYIVFDRNFNPLIGESGFIRITTASKEDGTNVPHDLLKPDQPLVIKQAGYVYIYLSNENDTPVEVFFDDFKVEHIKSPVVQMDDYYPFGLAFNSYSRENSIENRYLYNQGTGDKTFNTERVYDLGLNVDQSKYRTYDYITGRWWQVDPKADEDDLVALTSYNYSYNNPVRYNDPEGDCPLCAAVGAAVGAVVGGGIEAGMQLYEHGEVKDWGAVGGAALQGAVTGGVAGLTGGASLLVTTTASAGANVVGGALNNAVQGKEITAGSVAKDAVVGAAAGLGGKLLDKAINKGVVYLRTDATGGLKPYVGQAKNAERYAARQAEHARANPKADFSFKKIDKG
ncbi:MAG TPA: hypothetical protein VFI14_04880, partial [Chryseosolibacter sp.]|nr:hypothetical protein [Chryseosolibacter sp.]